MIVRLFPRVCRWMPLVLVLFLVPKLGGFAEDAPVPAKITPPKKIGNGWTFDEARSRLALSPRDPYLQFVLLQLSRREAREKEAYDAIEPRSPLDFIGGNQGRRSQTNLFGTFTGALAIQESMQLDTMRGGQTNASDPNRMDPVPKPPQPQKAAPEETVAVSTLTGPTVPSHPWEKMLAGKKSDVGPLAVCVPEEFYFAEFGSFARLHEVLGAADVWTGHIFTQVLGGARSQQTADRIRKQLGFAGLTVETIDRLKVEAVAITGSDPFLSEGSDITLLVTGRNVADLVTLTEIVKGDRSEKGEHAGFAYIHRLSSDGFVNVYSCSPRSDLHIRGNSLPAFKRVLEAVAGKTADGKPAGRLGESAEFRYVRTRMPRAADEEGFVYLSDAFIRHLTGPQLKLTERRRMLVYNHLRMIGHAALLFRAEHGRPPKSLEELAETKCAPGVFGKGDLAHPDGGTYSLTPDGMSGVCSKYGSAENLTPCLERLVTKVSGSEAEEYKNFVKDYSQYWRDYFDPIAVRVVVGPKQYKLETLVLPLIENSIYSDLTRNAGKPIAMDLLPTPKREIGGLWISLPKQKILDELGPDPDSPDPKKPAEDKAKVAQEPGKADTPANAAQTKNALRQIGLAFHNYHDAEGRFPTNIRDKDGKPLLSWRVAILPYLEEEGLYEKFKLDEPWDSENNKKLIEVMPKIYFGSDKKLDSAGKTSYLVFSGDNTLFPPEGNLKINDVKDELSKTILAIVADPAKSAAWTKPDDLPFDPKDPLKGVVRPGQDGIDVLMADGAVVRFSAKIDQKKFAAMVTPNGGEAVTLEEGEELTQASGSDRAGFLRELWPFMDKMKPLEDCGTDVKVLRRFLKDGIGDQIGLHMHDAPRLLDSDLSGLLENDNFAGLGLIVRFAFGASSISIPVKDPKVVDEFLEELDKVIVAQKKESNRGGFFPQLCDFYRVKFPEPHKIRCQVVNFAGLKWRVYWGRIGSGLYIATRPFILEDIAAAQSGGKKPEKTEPAHAVLRIRPENWKDVLPGYNLGWAESNRKACHANLNMLSNVNLGWNDKRPSTGRPTTELLARVSRVYGEQPSCPDGGAYNLSSDGQSCRCDLHGWVDDPLQPSAPTSVGSTGKLAKSFAGLTAIVRLEEDGLRVIVTIDRKE